MTRSEKKALFEKIMVVARDQMGESFYADQKRNMWRRTQQTRVNVKYYCNMYLKLYVDFSCLADSSNGAFPAHTHKQVLCCSEPDAAGFEKCAVLCVLRIASPHIKPCYEETLFNNSCCTAINKPTVAKSETKVTVVQKPLSPLKGTLKTQEHRKQWRMTWWLWRRRVPMIFI